MGRHQFKFLARRRVDQLLFAKILQVEELPRGLESQQSGSCETPPLRR